MSDVNLLPLVTAVTGLYAFGSIRLARRSAKPQAWRIACGLGGFGVLAALELPWFDAWGHALFTVHMSAHILLAAIAAPLLVLAQPVPALLWSLPRGLRGAFGAVLAKAVQWRIPAVLTAPLVAGTLHGVAIWAWHVPPLYEAALRNDWVHLLQHASFFLTGLAFWAAVFRPRQAGVAILLLFVTLTHTGLLGALMAFSTFAWYHGHTPELWGLTPLEDQQMAGLVMWVPASFIYLAAALWAGMVLLRDPPPVLGQRT